MAKLKAEVVDKQVQSALTKLQAAGQDTSPALNVIGRKLTTNIAMGFRSSTSPYGDRWKPIKSRVGLPLVDTGRLRKSLQGYQIGGTAEGKYVEVGTNVAYAPVHQYGAIFARGSKKGPSRITIPARPFMPIKHDQLVLPQEWSNDTLRALYNHFQRTGLF